MLTPMKQQGVGGFILYQFFDLLPGVVEFTFEETSPLLLLL